MSLDVSNLGTSNRNKINAQAALKLGMMLKCQRSQGVLSFLNLSYTNLGDFGLQNIASGIRGTNIKSLGLSQNDITSQGIEFLVAEGLLDNQTVAPNSPHNRHFFDPKEKIDVKDELLKRPVTNGLVDLDISLNHIGNQGVDILSTYIKSKYTSLILLNISACKIQIRGATNILRAISQQIYLQDFNIAKNDIGMNLRCNYIFEREHAGIFSHSLELALTASLRIVNFDACHFADRECQTISEALMESNFISSLSLKGNKITSGGVNYFSNALSSRFCELE